MKKTLFYIIIFAILTISLAAETTISGEFDYYMVNSFDKDSSASFADCLDKLELDFTMSAGDYSIMEIELEEDGSWNAGEGTYPEGTPSFNYAKITTDWGKLLNLEIIGIKTSVGLEAWETFDRVDFTSFGYEYADNWTQPVLDRDAGFRIELSFLDGMIRPYYAMCFDTVAEVDNTGKPAIKSGKLQNDEMQLLTGVGVDFGTKFDLPIWVEVYLQKPNVKDNLLTGVEVMFDRDFSTDSWISNIKAGGWLNSMSDDNKHGEIYGISAAVSAWGFTLAASIAGCVGSDYFDKYFGENSWSPLSVAALEAEYEILEWLSLNAGIAFAFNDYKEMQAGDKSLQSFEIGTVIRPSAGVQFRLGYILVDEDVSDAVEKGTAYFFRTMNTDGVVNNKGGLYFATKIDY